MDDPIHERGKAIEDLFFASNDKKLLDKLRQDLAAEESRASLQAASGIKDTAVLDVLLANQITPETLASFGLVPLVAVAWADNVMEEAERNAILQAADIAGVKMESVSYQALEKWLTKKPQPEILQSWKAYVGALKSTLEPAPFSQLKANILERAETVAKAAGGFLGLGNKVSDSEQDVLDELARAFD